MQMHRSGLPEAANCFTGSVNPSEFNAVITASLAPTPGKTAASADASSSGSDVMTGFAPTFRRALSTLCTLAARVLIITIFGARKLSVICMF